MDNRRDGRDGGRAMTAMEFEHLARRRELELAGYVPQSTPYNRINELVHMGSPLRHLPTPNNTLRLGSVRGRPEGVHGCREAERMSGFGAGVRVGMGDARGWSGSGWQGASLSGHLPHTAIPERHAHKQPPHRCILHRYPAWYRSPPRLARHPAAALTAPLASAAARAAPAARRLRSWWP